MGKLTSFAWHTASGLSLDYWLSRLLNLLHILHREQPFGYLFRTSENSTWTSQDSSFYHIYHPLHLQYLTDDAILRHINITSFHHIPYYIYYMHFNRRAEKTHCSRKRDGCIRKVMDSEETDFGRWQIKKKGKEGLHTHYRRPSIGDRVYLNLLCF